MIEHAMGKLPVLDVVDTRFGHFFVRFTRLEENDARYRKTTTVFQEQISLEDRIWVNNRRLWCVRGTDKNYKILSNMFSDFAQRMEWAKAQLHLIDEDWENPFEKM